MKKNKQEIFGKNVKLIHGIRNKKMLKLGKAGEKYINYYCAEK